MTAKSEAKVADKKRLTPAQKDIEQALAAGSASGAQKVDVPRVIVRRQAQKAIAEAIKKGT